jgi:hypothetical protein
MCEAPRIDIDAVLMIAVIIQAPNLTGCGKSREFRRDMRSNHIPVDARHKPLHKAGHDDVL